MCAVVCAVIYKSVCLRCSWINRQQQGITLDDAIHFNSRDNVAALLVGVSRLLIGAMPVVLCQVSYCVISFCSVGYSYQ